MKLGTDDGAAMSGSLSLAASSCRPPSKSTSPRLNLGEPELGFAPAMRGLWMTLSRIDVFLTLEPALGPPRAAETCSWARDDEADAAEGPPSVRSAEASVGAREQEAIAAMCETAARSTEL